MTFAIDRFGGSHARATGEAIAAHEDAVLAFARHRPNVIECLDRALSIEPRFAAAHALRGFALVLLAGRDFTIQARARLHSAEAAMATLGERTAGEAALVAALARAVDGHLIDAADILDRHIAVQPRDFVALKLAHALRFMAGDARGMLASTGGALSEWSPDAAAFGHVLGCHAFALEETGDLDAAERVAKRALAAEPLDAWGLHALAHVHEMTGRFAAGFDLIEATRPVWRRCNNFAFHVAWHQALFAIEDGRPETALRLYDTEIRAQPTDDFRDMANAISLLWRLGLDGLAVGDRRDERGRRARARRRDTTLVFAALHGILAMIATGDFAGARDAVAALDEHAARRDDDQASVAATAGVPLAQALLGHDGGGKLVNLVALGGRLPALGGSHAQRDVFLRTLIQLAQRTGDHPAARRMLMLRGARKNRDRFARHIEGRMVAPKVHAPSRRAMDARVAELRP